MDWKLAPRALPMSQMAKLFLKLVRLAPNTVYKPPVLVQALIAINTKKTCNFSVKDCI